MTRSLAVEWGEHGICVNAIPPGIFPTDLKMKLPAYVTKTNVFRRI